MEPVILEAQSESARFLPGFGCHCIAYRVAGFDVIVGPENMDALRAHPFRSGIPIMFPWPGRIAGGRFSWNGVEYSMPLSEPARGNSIHGLIADRPFRLDRRGPYFMNCVLDSAADSVLSAAWPWRFVLEIDCEVGNGLRMRAVVRNTGDAPMPFGLGIHPYFSTPFDTGHGRGDVRVMIPADQHLSLDERMIPRAVLAADGRYDFRRARELRADAYDDVFRLSRAPADGKAITSRLIGPARRITIEIGADASFRHWVLYAPPDKPVCAIEPYTCAPNAFNAPDPAEAGTITLMPGAEWVGRLEIRLTSP